MPSTPDNSLRKAALLVSSLDASTAAHLLAKLPPDQSQRLRDALNGIGEAPPQEEAAAIEEFLRIGPMPAAPELRREPSPRREPAPRRESKQNFRAADYGGIELDDGLARLLAADDATKDLDGGMSLEGPFAFLHQAEPFDVAEVLQEERPQAIAVVIAHLPARQGSELLSYLPAPVQADVARRLSRMEQADDEVLRALADSLASRLNAARGVQTQARGVDSLRRLLSDADGRSRQSVLANLERHDPDLARAMQGRSDHSSHDLAPHAQAPRGRAASPQMGYDDLAVHAPQKLAELLTACDPHTALTVLYGADADERERLLAALPRALARAFRFQLQDFGPLRESEIELARAQVAALARRRQARSPAMAFRR